MSPTQRKATIRLVAGSFIAGASVMAVVGLVGPVAVQGGLSVRDAFASTFEEPAPLIEPLDVAVIEAQLAEANREVETMREATADEFQHLDRLAGR
jgi:hypothetical protein